MAMTSTTGWWRDAGSSAPYTCPSPSCARPVGFGQPRCFCGQEIDWAWVQTAGSYEDEGAPAPGYALATSIGSLVRRVGLPILKAGVWVGVFVVLLAVRLVLATICISIDAGLTGRRG